VAVPVRRHLTFCGWRGLAGTQFIQPSPQEEKHDPEAEDENDEEGQFLLLVKEALAVPHHLMLNQVGGGFLDDGD
jgi:hypothetical protein